MKSIVCLLVCMLTVAIVPGTAGAQESDCPATRLSAGGQGIVTPGASNRIRSTPSTDGELLGNIPSGGSFDLLEGPECSGGFLWWRHVQNQNELDQAASLCKTSKTKADKAFSELQSALSEAKPA